MDPGTGKDGEQKPPGVDENGSKRIIMKGKSCKGALYYSSVVKSKGRSPTCVGLSRTLAEVPGYIVGETEVEASKEGRSLSDFKYACVGYSVYLEQHARSEDKPQEPRADLPVCIGLELVVDKRPAGNNAPAPTHAPAHAHSAKDDHHVHHPPTPTPTPIPTRPQRPPHTLGDEFLTKFARNANLVASGVARNMRKAGNYVKESVDDILFPYKRPPK